jgi:3-hydroxyisobutyrate dehydrogenase-like beta-hydroxyacid dehydrogenase
LNTASPGVKRQLAKLGESRGIPVTDIAMMAPVPGKGLKVPMLASGAGVGEVATQLTSLGANIEVLDGPAGLAATRKLLRSVYYKGMAASIVEALDAAGAAGYEDWLRAHIAEDLAKLDASTLDRIVTGTRQHAVRRGAEMGAAAQMLTELGIEPIMADASRLLHERVARDGS